jgi:hypothetical protein
MDERIGTLSFDCTAGAFIRKQLRHSFETAKFEGWDIEWIENKNWTSSRFFVKVKGTESQLHSFRKTYENWMRNFE